jgi:predicted membrane protein (TIGR00267 family)
MPILPFFFIKSDEIAKKISLGVASIIFFLIGYIKGFVIKENKLYAGMETLLIGLSAALISYAVGKTIHQMLPEETLNNVL